MPTVQGSKKVVAGGIGEEGRNGKHLLAAQAGVLPKRLIFV
jgi:hypothetical protein